VKGYRRPSGAAKRPRPEGPSPSGSDLQQALRRAFPAVAAKLTWCAYGYPRQTIRKRSVSVLQAVPVASKVTHLATLVDGLGTTSPRTTTVRVVGWRKIVAVGPT
jgi:hypothetical protein